MNGDRFAGPRMGRRAFVKGAAGAMALPLVGLPGARAQEPVDIVIWQWAPGFEIYIDEFNKTHPNIRLSQVQTTGSADTGLKLRNALLAGSGGPDVTFCNYWMFQTMDYAGAFLDITAQAEPFRDLFIPAFFDAGTVNGQIKMLPLDAPAMLQLFRADVLEEYGIAVPVTWDDLANASEAVRSKSPDQYMTNALFANGEWTTALLWQAGWEGFKLDGENLTVDINGPAAQKVADYWQPLIDGKLVSNDAPFTSEFFQSMDNGKYLDVMAGSWIPAYASGNLNQTLGKWRVAHMPYWTADDQFSTLFGGAGFGVYSQTQHPEEAFEVVKWLTTESPAVDWWITKNSLVLPVKSLLEDPALRTATYPISSDQKVNEIAFEAVARVKKPFTWAPFQDFVLQTLLEELSASADGGSTLIEGFGRAQDKVVAYAQDQGFTVV